MYDLTMLNRFALPILVTCSGLSVALADTIQLKDKASITGKVLARKRDQVVVDVGYTALVIPRNQIEKIIEGEAPIRNDKKPPAAPRPTAAQPDDEGLFQSSPSLPERSVRELVGELGVAVVQVRTPGGLGSGFIIHDDGYLITNFHVIENETQISV